MKRVPDLSLAPFFSSQCNSRSRIALALINPRRPLDCVFELALFGLNGFPA
jgi:hypothetical protein